MAKMTANPSHGSGAGQEEEINSLRDHFKDNIRILSSIGQFSYILKIRADQFDVSLTLQLDQSYPSKTPDIIITAPRLTPDQILLVQQLLQSYSETLLNRPMILLVHSRLLQWFDENNIQTLSATMNNNTPTLPSTPRSPVLTKFVSPFSLINNQNRTSQNEFHDQEQIKQCSTITIENAISRIESDNRLDKRYIRVGYLDRLLGLQEKLYQDLDFKIDPSNIHDRSALALVIPKHLIQYFKYGHEMIWDRERRTDLLFGSTGDEQTIDDIINRHRNLLETVNSSVNSHNDQIIDVNQTLPIKRFLTVTDGLTKPNYFLSIPITDPSLITHYITYREHFLASYPSLLSSTSSHMFSCDPAHLHLTLLTLRLGSSVQLEQCILALKRIQEEIHYHCSYPERICLEFNGLDTFVGKTFYIKCHVNSRLDNLRTLIIERLCEQQQKQKMNELFFAGNYQEFIPHIILFRSKRKLSVLPHHETQEIYFGKQTIDGLHLSSIDINENDQQSHCVFKLDLS